MFYERKYVPKDDRGPLDLTRQIGELQCEIEGLKTKVHDAELETSLVKAVGMNSPEMKTAKEEINELKNKIADLENTLESKDYFEKPDYKFLVEENLDLRRKITELEQEILETKADNIKLSQQIDDQVDRLRKAREAGL